MGDENNVTFQKLRERGLEVFSGKRYLLKQFL
jgi:biotin operon repressor